MIEGTGSSSAPHRRGHLYASSEAKLLAGGLVPQPQLASAPVNRQAQMKAGRCCCPEQARTCIKTRVDLVVSTCRLGTI